MAKASMKEHQAEKLAFKVVEDMGGAFVMALGYIGWHLGLFEALAGSGPMTIEALAEKTKLNEKYVRDWAKAMAAAEYIDYEPDTEKFEMTEEQAFVLTNRDSPLFVGGALQFATPTTHNVPEIMEAFKSGGGIPWLRRHKRQTGTAKVPVTF